MPYQGVALAVLLGVGIAAIIYLFAQGPEVQAHNSNYRETRPPPDTSYKPWDDGYDTNRRRRRCSSVKSRQSSCTICLDNLVDNVKILPCKHRFHENCIKKWLNENESRTCPLCRKEVHGM